MHYQQALAVAGDDESVQLMWPGVNCEREKGSGERSRSDRMSSRLLRASPPGVPVRTGDGADVSKSEHKSKRPDG